MCTRKSAGKLKNNVSRLHVWVTDMWTMMSVTGNGYHRPSTRHTGEDDDRRKDKLREVFMEDAKGKEKVEYHAFMFPESKLQRRFRLKTL